MQSWNDFWQQRRWDGWKPWAKQVMRFEAECGWLCEGGIEMKMREEQIWGATNGACQVVLSRLGDWIKTQNVTQIVSQIMIHTMTEIWIVDWNLRYELQFRAWPKSELEFKSYLKSDSVWEIRPWLKSENSNHDRPGVGLQPLLAPLPLSPLPELLFGNFHQNDFILWNSEYWVKNYLKNVVIAKFEISRYS